MDSFTCNITSNDNIQGPNRMNDVKIKLTEFPPQYRYFKCKVLNFNYNFSTVDNTDAWRQFRNFYLVSDNLISGYHPTSGNRSFDIIANMTGHGGLNGTVGSEFTIENPNHKTLNFQFLDSDFVMVPDARINIASAGGANNTSTWVLTLLITPIEKDPNNYNLRNGFINK